jgi:N-formylglutamate deformylase
MGTDGGRANSTDGVASRPVSFRLVRPRGREVPIVVEVPHAGLRLDPSSLSVCIAPARSIGRDADLFVDELYADAPDVGASLLVAEMSRYVCDLNRNPTDLDRETSPLGRLDGSPYGVIWRKSTDGYRALASELDAKEVERRLRDYYRPYHEALTHLLEEKKQRFGYVLLICAHSMPSLGRGGEPRADVVPGSRGRSSANPELVDAVEAFSKSAGYSVLHDDPYRGGFATEWYGQPISGQHAIQIELSRRLYMNEANLARDEGHSKMRDFCRDLVEYLAEKTHEILGRVAAPLPRESESRESESRESESPRPAESAPGEVA